MRYGLLLPLLALFFTNAHAAGADKACWDEWEYQDQALVRAYQCTENVSLSSAELAKTFCTSRVSGDTPRTAAQCPSTMKAKRGTSVVTVKVQYTCTGISPMGLTGKAKVYYYENPEADVESLQGLCKAFGGSWSTP